MKKLFLLGSILLFSSFSLANKTNNELYFEVEDAVVGGWCTVKIYQGNTLVYSETSWQASSGDCSAWAAGRYWTFVVSFPPAS